MLNYPSYYYCILNQTHLPKRISRMAVAWLINQLFTCLWLLCLIFFSFFANKIGSLQFPTLLHIVKSNFLAYELNMYQLFFFCFTSPP